MDDVMHYVVSLFLSIFFLIIGTVLCYKLHLNYQEANGILEKMNTAYYLDNQEIDNLVKCSDKEISNLKTYVVKVNNDSLKNQNYYLRLIQKDNYYLDKIDNNYIKYVIKRNDGSYGEVRSLNMNGRIYFDSLASNSETIYEIKIWVSENYLYDYNFHGNFMIQYL